MKLYLEGGGHTIVFFYKDSQGTTYPFPVENADIVRSHGTKESKEMLERILKDGVTALRDRLYIAFMGPPRCGHKLEDYVMLEGGWCPIPPYKIRCYCGHEIKVGRDDKGYYIEGASEITFEPGGKALAEERVSGS